jgi:two-component system, NarL family, response regulator DevR
MSETPLDPIRVLIIDDHRMFADSLARLLSDESDIAVVGVYSTGAEGVAQAAALTPAVVLVDYRLPDLDGVEITSQIKAHAPDRYVVMLTGSADDGVLLSAIEAGCSGYLTKDRAAAEVAEAVRLAAAGEATISPRELARLLPKLGRNQRSVGSDLSAREREILAMLATGSANSAIATALHLSVNTVRNYVQSILTKLGAHSKLEAVAIGVREGILRYPSGPSG